MAMGLSLRQSRRILSVFIADALQYRMELVLWMMGTVLPFIMMGVWMEVSRAGGTEQSPEFFGRYFFATFLVRNLTLVWVVWVFEQHVVQGILSHRMLQPMDPGWRFLLEHIAERIVRGPMLIIVGVVFFVLYPEALWKPNWHTLLAIPAIVLTFLMRFAVQYAFAQLAFWTERAHAVEQLWALPYMFFSGMIAPLELYPEGMQQVLMYTPFPYLIWYPSTLLVGESGGINPLMGLGMTIGWGIVFYAIYRWLWRKGLAKYSGMGA